MKDYISKNTYFLLRHGEGEHNVMGFLADAAYDKVRPAHLTVQGKDNVWVAAKELATDDIDVIYASPLTRTMETAAIVAKKLGGMDIIRDERLREVDFGEFSGKDVSEMRELYEEYGRFEARPEGGENLDDIRVRVQEFIDEVHEEYDKKNILIVGHGDPLWVIEAVLEGFPNEDIEEVPYIEPGELRVLKG